MEEQVLSIEQMRELIELGIDTSKASMCWNTYDSFLIANNSDLKNAFNYSDNDWAPTFTLQDCIKLIPGYIEDEYGNGFSIRYSKNFAWYQEEFGNGTLIVFDNCNFLLENCFNMLKWCKQNNYI